MRVGEKVWLEGTRERERGRERERRKRKKYLTGFTQNVVLNITISFKSEVLDISIRLDFESIHCVNIVLVLAMCCTAA